MDYQHCPACEEEYVTGVAACAECGGPLCPGPLARFAPSAGTPAVAPAADADELLERLPGLQADHAVRALLLEGISCRVECRGLTKTYAPGSPPAEPFAVSLTVALYVPRAQRDAAREVLSSLGHDDLIGDQWSAPEDGGTPDDDVIEAQPAVAREPESDASPPADFDAAGAPAAEGTGLRTVLLIVAALVALLFLFGP